MKTCKDCIHENLCVIKAFPEAFENTKWEKEPCNHFKSKANVVEVQNIAPCDVCAYSPPSSFDGKPCSMCPAIRMQKEGAE